MTTPRYQNEFLKSCDSLSDRGNSFLSENSSCADLSMLSGEKVHLEAFKEGEKEYSILSFFVK